MTIKQLNLTGALVIHTGTLGLALWWHLMPIYLVMFLFTWANNLSLRVVK